jgi:hypothetical protein
MNQLKKKPFVRFLLKLVLLFTIVFIIDYSVGNILSYYYYRQVRGSDYLTTYAIEKTTADLIVFGSSRANHHYDPDIFSRSLHLSFFNAGRDGNFLFYHYAVLKGVLKRYSPKMVILDFMPGEFEINQDSYDRLSTLLPYYDKHPEMRSVIELKSPFEKIKTISSLYRNNSNLLIIAGGNALFSKKKREDDRGYIPLNTIWNHPIKNDLSPFQYKLDSQKIKTYESFIHDCLSSNVKLYIICSPIFLREKFPNYSIRVAETIAQKNKVMFFDFSEDSFFVNSPKLFSDPEHLNADGAKIFSTRVTDSILKHPYQ